jgi:antitoxin component of RelBE/YafQ-DinJ toxin-antitoxin module
MTPETPEKRKIGRPPKDVSSTMMRIDTHTKDKLKALSKKQGISLSQAVEFLLKQYNK